MKLKKQTVSDEIPTSSMADIAFLLIIYFMVTATFAATRGLDFALPKEDDTPPIIEKEDSVLIEIQPGGVVVIDQGQVTINDIADQGMEIIDYLKPKLDRNPKKPVIIKPDRTAEYGFMVGVFDILRQAKLIENQLVTRADVPTLSEEDWDAGKEINISIPTQREIDAFWF